MSDENQKEGQDLYLNGDDETKFWFQEQWKIWPKRKDPRFTTNLNFHYGGVLGFRKENNKDPQMSCSFRDCVQFMDKDLKSDLCK